MTILSEPSDDIVDSDVDRSIKSCRPSSVGENRRFRRDTIPQQKYFQPEMFVNTFDFQLFARGIGHNTIIHVLLPHFPADKNVLSQDCPNLFFSEDIGSDNLSEDTDFVISSICAISKNLRIILYVSGSENFEEGIAAMFNNIYDTIDRNPKEFHIINFLIESQSLANWQEAFQRWFQPAFDKKVLVISAAGSSSTDDPIKMPWTTQPYVISVGGVVYANSQEVPILYSTSNYGLNVPIYAPARSAYYPNNGDQNIEKFGTSFAAARFAAIVGLIANQVILQVDPGDDLIKIYMMP
jgi:hypothetical protein